MTQRCQDISVYRGDTAAVTVTLTRADGTLLDPTEDGLAIKWRMATTSDSPADLLSKQLGAGIEFAPGGVTIALTSTETDFEPGVYYHELRVISGPDVDTAMTGAFVVRRTRWLAAA